MGFRWPFESNVIMQIMLKAKCFIRNILFISIPYLKWLFMFAFIGKMWIEMFTRHSNIRGVVRKVNNGKITVSFVGWRSFYKMTVNWKKRVCKKSYDFTILFSKIFTDFYMHCFNWAQFHISKTSGDIKQLKGKLVTLFQSKLFFNFIHFSCHLTHL